MHILSALHSPRTTLGHVIMSTITPFPLSLHCPSVLSAVSARNATVHVWQKHMTFPASSIEHCHILRARPSTPMHHGKQLSAVRAQATWPSPHRGCTKIAASTSPADVALCCLSSCCKLSVASVSPCNQQPTSAYENRS